ncbi:DUF2357 domain-containing protein [Rhodocaloribacter sp.]
MTLFTIETGAVRLVWSRTRAKPPAVVPAGEAGPCRPEVRTLLSGVTPVVGTRAKACLFEQTDYTLFVQSRTGARVALRHRDPALVRGLHTSDDGRIVHGVINFGAQVGESRFVVEVDGAPHVAFTVEVFPSKLDYRRDYEAIRADVEDIAEGLAYEYLRATTRPARSVATRRPDAAAWATLLRHVLGALERALDHVARHPGWSLARATEPVRAERIRRSDTAVLRAVRKGGGHGDLQRMRGGVPVRRRLPARRAVYTLDTPEHRWLAAQLRQVRARLARLSAEERRRRPGLRHARALGELDDMARRAARLAALEPWRDLEGGAPATPTLRLLTAPGYREAYQTCLLLRRGLTLEGGPLALSLKDLHLLYEYWCFLTLVRLAAEVTGAGLPAEQLLTVERYGLRMRLRRGRAQTVTFPLAGSRRLAITYNPRFGGKGYLVPQQPDLVLSLGRPGGPRTRYVLDAKYRLDASPAYVRRFGIPGPPVDALNALHRYRDAILDRDRRERGGRTVAQAVALYPYREPEPGTYAAGRHGRALEEVGVGAIPLLPGATAHLEAWLHGVLAGEG